MLNERSKQDHADALSTMNPPARTVAERTTFGLAEVDSARRKAEQETITAALHSTMWNRKQAAKLLKIDYKALLYKMKKLGIGEKHSDFTATELE